LFVSILFAIPLKRAGAENVQKYQQKRSAKYHSAGGGGNSGRRKRIKINVEEKRVSGRLFGGGGGDVRLARGRPNLSHAVPLAEGACDPLFFYCFFVSVFCVFFFFFFRPRVGYGIRGVQTWLECFLCAGWLLTGLLMPRDEEILSLFSVLSLCGLT